MANLAFGCLFPAILVVQGEMWLNSSGVVRSLSESWGCEVYINFSSKLSELYIVLRSKVVSFREKVDLLFSSRFHRSKHR